VIAWMLWSVQPKEWIAAAVIVGVAALVYVVTLPSRRARARAAADAAASPATTARA
jgi:hypothetical protein